MAVRTGLRVAATWLATTLAATGGNGPTVAASPSHRAVGPAKTGDACRHFRRNPMCEPLPRRPSLSPHSVEWAAEESPGAPGVFAPLQIVVAPAHVTSPELDSFDSSEPLYAPTHDTVPHVVACDAGPAYGRDLCERTHLAGATVNVPRGAYPAGNSDRHLSWDDAAAGGEYDLWLATTPDDVPRSVLHVGAAGFCAWQGDGTACSAATATNIATSLGGIDPVQLRERERDPHGALPYALGTAALCADASYVAPANASDGRNTDATAACAAHLAPGHRPPEGVRYFLDRSDREIDATANAPYVKVILRTLDREHLGGTITDTNWSRAPGLAFAVRRGDWRAIAREAGLAGDHVSLPITTDGIDVRRDLRFCATGTCRPALPARAPKARSSPRPFRRSRRARD